MGEGEGRGVDEVAFRARGTARGRREWAESRVHRTRYIGPRCKLCVFQSIGTWLNEGDKRWGLLTQVRVQGLLAVETA